MEDFHVIDKCLMVKLPEEIDHYRSSYICERADYFIMNKDVDHVVFDFEATHFMDSSGIGIIMEDIKKYPALGVRFMYFIRTSR